MSATTTPGRDRPDTLTVDAQPPTAVEPNDEAHQDATQGKAPGTSEPPADAAPGSQTTPDTRHTYLSTGCYHNNHEYCASMTGYQGTKRPAQCKFCNARCVCPCHQPES